MKIIRERKRVEEFTYGLSFHLIECPSAGCSFDCDEYGNIFMDDLEPVALNTLETARAGVGTLYHEPEVTRYVSRYVDHAVGICNGCGREVVLSDPLDNECVCHRIYNMCGQELKPRDQWEEPMDYDY